MVTLFGSTRRTSGRVTLPAELELKVAFGELKLDLREALFPDQHVVLYCESLCASVEVLLPSLDSIGPVLPVLREAATAANRHLEPAVRGAVGPLAESVSAAHVSRRGADRVPAPRRSAGR